MARRKYTPEQIISKLREVEVALAQGATVSLAARGIGVTDQTYYRWRREYGGLTVEQAKRLKELEKENLRLRRAVCSLSAFNRFTRKSLNEGPVVLSLSHDPPNATFQESETMKKP